MEVIWRKKLLIFSIFLLLFGTFAKANLREKYLEQQSVNETNCNWKNAQFNHFVFSKVTRYCVDYKNKTIFLVKEDSGWVPTRQGLLNRGENVRGDYGYWRKQWNVEGNNLIKYFCRINSLSSTSCDGEVMSITEGYKR